MTRRRPTHRLLFGNAIRVRRTHLGLSQEKLAELADCHRNYIGIVERGEQNISIDMIVRLAAALKCAVRDIMKDAGL